MPRLPPLLLLCLLLVCNFSGPVQRVGADAAPYPGSGASDGRNVNPTALTNVQMVSETVMLDAQRMDFFAVDPNFPESFHVALVTADFLLRNPTGQAESLPVGFPLYLEEQSQERAGYPEILDLQVFINNSPMATTPQLIENKLWALWDMTLPPGDTQLRVTYTFIARQGPEGVAPAVIYGYVLHTGAGWAGPIGQGEVIVRFPFPIDEALISPVGTTPGYTLGDFEVRWHFDNLEPTLENDIRLKLANPDIWREVVAPARQAVLRERSAANYWALAKAYAGVLVEDKYASVTDSPEADSIWAFRSPLLASIVVAQYQKAIELDPGNRLLRVEFAEFVLAQRMVNLPTQSAMVLTQVAKTPFSIITLSTTPPGPPTAVAQVSATAPQSPIAPQSPTAVRAATQAPLTAPPSNPAPATLTPLAAAPSKLAPTAQATAIPPTPTATFDWTPWLVGATLFTIVLGLSLALRRK